MEPIPTPTHNNSNKPPPSLPPGTGSVWRGITENFAFHASPESFIAAKVSAYYRQRHQSLQDSSSSTTTYNSRAVVRAKILNRDVAIVSSYGQVARILLGGGSYPASSSSCLREGEEDADDGEDRVGEEESSPSVVAREAYNDFMGQFFPVPNLLMTDGCPHTTMKKAWNDKMSEMHARLREKSRDVVTAFIRNIQSPVQVDLYDCMKTLAWRVLLACFLDLSDDDALYVRIKQLQEDLLRGQFSLMPVSVDVGFWRSPRKQGINARKTLQRLIGERLRGDGEDSDLRKLYGLSNCNRDQVEEVINHVLMMTSSLAAKGLASLLTACLLNLYLYNTGEGLLYKQVLDLSDADQRLELLRSVYLETERLSPPIVGVMRRLKRDIVLESGDDTIADVLLPAGWDAWLYFVGAGRDESVFGEDCNVFNPTRYLDRQTPLPFGFGSGSKACLGRDFIREFIISVAEGFLTQQLVIRGQLLEPGVKGWLGWSVVEPEVWAKDMKQLPTQHPVGSVVVEISRT